MKITNLKISNFRNHKELETNFSHTNIIFGANGSGKTSILEAIILLSTSRSNRSKKVQEMIRWGSEASLLGLRTSENGEKRILRLALDSKNSRGRTFSLDGKIFEPKEVVGRLLTVFFAPEALDILIGSPAKRRRFLDVLLSQTDNSYLTTLIEFKKTLFNRNRLLKDLALGKREKEELVFWDKQLVITGSFIVQKRKEACEILDRHFGRHHKKIMRRGGKATIKYAPSVVQRKDHESTEGAYTERLVSDFVSELKYGSTLSGPHRDDLRFLVGSKDAASFSSRGEVRTIIIALKLAEVDYIRQQTEQEPVVLLDDIYSELDARRGAYLTKMLARIPQTIITTSDKKIAQNLLKRGAKLIKLVKKKAHA